MVDGLINRLKELEILYRIPPNLRKPNKPALYVHLKKAIGYPDILNLMCDSLKERMKSGVTCVAGSGVGGIPLASAISSRYGLRLSIVRDTPKIPNQWIEGYCPNEEDKIAIVDDTILTGESLMKMIRVMKRTRAEVVGCYVVCKRGNVQLNEGLEFLITPEDLL